MLTEVAQTRDINLEVKMSISGRIVEPQTRLFNTVKYIESTRVPDGDLELGYIEHDGKILVLCLRVQEGSVIGLKWMGVEGRPVDWDDILYGAIIKAAWSEEGVNLDDLNTAAMPLSSFIESFRADDESSSFGYESQEDMKFMIRVISLGEYGTFLCAHIPGRWVECLHLAR